MNTAQIQLVQSRFAQVEPIADVAARLFYDKLFKLDPSIKPLFTSDFTEQGKKRMKLLGIAVRGLSNLDALLPAIQALGKRHVGYGVMDAHHATVGAALLWTLEQGLDAALTGDVKAAWTETCSTLASVMQAAAEA